MPPQTACRGSLGSTGRWMRPGTAGRPSGASPWVPWRGSAAWTRPAPGNPIGTRSDGVSDRCHLVGRPRIGVRLALGALPRRLGRWSPAGRPSPGRARPSPRARRSHGSMTGRSPGLEPHDRLPGPGVWHPIGTHFDGAPSSPVAPSATPTTSPPPWPDRGLALGPGEGGRDTVCREPCCKETKGERGRDQRRSGTGRASTATSSGPCRAGRDPKPGGGEKGCPFSLVSVTVPEGRRLLVVALPARRSFIWRGRGGAEPRTGEPGAATPVVARSKASTRAHESQRRLQDEPDRREPRRTSRRRYSCSLPGARVSSSAASRPHVDPIE
jgi:hypothetical protein